MNFSELIFDIVVLVTLGGAALAVLSSSIVYALIGLVAAMFGIAGLYVYLNSPFLAMMQILIYVGAVTVLISFAVMLAGPLYRRPREWTTAGKFTAAFGVALAAMIIIVRFVTATFPNLTKPAFAITTKDIGTAFFDKLVLPFEMISVLIVVAILGAIMLALFSRGDSQ
jgi:NADH-quinone oxidoreductase subunit J